MGLLDWLTDGIGSDPGQGGMGAGGLTMPSPPSQPDASTLPTPPSLPPSAAPPIDPSTTDVAGGMTGTGPQAVPLPMARPAGAPPPPPVATAAPAALSLPPNATPTAGAPLSLAPDNPGPTAPYKLGDQTALGKALGIDPKSNSFNEALASLGGGLTAAGNSKGKSGGQAFASGAGGALTAGSAKSDKITDQQAKFLQQAIEASKAGDTATANTALTRLRVLQGQKIQQDMADKTNGTGKESVVNSQQQLYLRGVAAANADGKLSLLKQTYMQASKDGNQNTPEAKAAKQAYDDAYDATLKGHLTTLGVDPKTADKLAKQPGMSLDNPVPAAKITSQADFDKLPVGSYFTNPADGSVRIKQAAQGGATPAATGGGGSDTPAAEPKTDPEADTD